MQADSTFAKKICQLCAEICETCGNECKKHGRAET
ncbi:four-helix bundle copper-binding protein [Siminovitchia terrae]